MAFTIGTGIYGFFLTFFVYLGALAGEALFLTYGILAVIPAGPFEHQNLGLGVPLIVLGVIGIAAIGGAIAGLITGGILCSPLICIGCVEEV
jgi:hypothetical protein